MAVPDFQTIMLPLLKIAGDGQEHSGHEFLEQRAQHFELTDEDRKFERHWGKKFLKMLWLVHHLFLKG